MESIIRKARKEDLDRCAEIRGLTRDNPISREVLISYGVTKESWVPKFDEGRYEGFVAQDKTIIVGYCFADTTSGEIMVIAMLPAYEGQGLGKKLLHKMVDKLWSFGHRELWLAATPDLSIRAYGFYRNLGWESTGTFDEHSDEILKLKKI